MDKYKTLPLPTPDFDKNKQLLKEFFQQNPNFTDYNFDGSNLSFLLDVLAANTHTNAFFLNQVGNESTLSTAFKRDSVGNRALDLGYVIRNVRSAQSMITIELFSLEDRVDIPLGYVFKATDSDLKFVTLQPYTVFRNEGRLLAEIEVFQGKLLTHRYVYSEEANDAGQFVIPNPNVDESKVFVTVKNPSDETSFEFSQQDKVLRNTNSSKVYYLRYRDGLYFVEFGRDLFGVSPEQGAEISISYLLSDGESGNFASKFSPEGAIPNVSSITVLSSTSSSGGQDPESIQSAKSNARRSFRTQDSAVIPDDYAFIAQRELSIVQDAIAWGGETTTPPTFGAVFVAPRPLEGLVFTDEQKQLIRQTLQRYSVSGTRINIVDPEYLFVRLIAQARYDTNNLEGSESDLINKIIEAVNSYADSIESTSREFSRSEISRIVDNASPSVLSNELQYSLEKRIIVNEGISNTITIRFPVTVCSFESTTFSTDGINSVKLVDNGNQVDLVDITNEIIQPNIGTFDGQNIEVTNITIFSSSVQDEFTLQPLISIFADVQEQYVKANVNEYLELIVDNIRVVPS